MQSSNFHRLQELKQQAGSHSPSLQTILNSIPDLKINVDACFLSNPYATNLFIEYFTAELLQTGLIRRYLEYYPSQNNVIARHISRVICVPPKNIFVANGAIEAIQAILHKCSVEKVVIPIPTFSPYYEFLKPSCEAVFFNVFNNASFGISPDKLVDFVLSHQADALVIINPNNPDGSFITRNNILKILEDLSHLSLVIVDESFVDFASDGDPTSSVSISNAVERFPNLVVIKSMSKDFGIAGVRAGYAVMSEQRVSEILSNGHLWNVSGLAEYFFELYSRPDFSSKYQAIRLQYIDVISSFYESLKSVSCLKVYPSKANFFLCALLNGQKSSDFCIELLSQHGIYARDCQDKIGLNGEFIRIACRSSEENMLLIKALSHYG
jgi:histidinol-phosphate/aromatic aminotransferase/cobyric acid decarboxylase-like protein